MFDALSAPRSTDLDKRLDAGLRDAFSEPGLKLVEWPQHVAGMLPLPDAAVLLRASRALETIAKSRGLEKPAPAELLRRVKVRRSSSWRSCTASSNSPWATLCRPTWSLICKPGRWAVLHARPSGSPRRCSVTGWR